ncbi:MAG: M48 family metalloprotease [Pseudomonadota bacterium]
MRKYTYNHSRIVFKKLSLLLFGLLISTATLAHGPDLSHGEYAALPLHQEKQLGQQFMREVRQQLPLSDDPIVNDYITHLGLHLASFSPRADFSFHFFVVQSSEINAFAGPGGYIGINSGLILAAHSERELAAVMAHEIAHVTQRHIARSIENANRLQWASILGLLAAIPAGIQSPDAAIGLIGATQAAALEKMLGFSRDYEREADDVGIQIMAAAGYSTAGMTEFLKILLANHYPSDYDPIIENLSTHPDSAERVARSLTFEDQPQTTSERFDSRQFHLIQARLLIEAYQNTTVLTKDLKEDLDSHKTPPASLRYALALALLQSNQLTQAQQQISRLTKQFPDELILQMTALQITQAQGKTDIALKGLKQLYNDHPDYFPLLLQYAKALTANGQTRQALKLLQAERSEHQHDLAFLTTLASTQNAAGDKIDMYQTQADIYLILGQEAKALALLQNAKRISGDRIEMAKIARKIKAIRKSATSKKN